MPCFVLYSKATLACYSRYLLTSYFCIPVPYDGKGILLLLLLVLEDLVGLHIQLNVQIQIFIASGCSIALTHQKYNERKIQWKQCRLQQNILCVYNCTWKGRPGCFLSQSFWIIYWHFIVQYLLWSFLIFLWYWLNHLQLLWSRSKTSTISPLVCSRLGKIHLWTWQLASRY